MNIPEEHIQLSDQFFEEITGVNKAREALFKEVLIEHYSEVISLINNYLPGKYRGAEFKVSELAFHDDLSGELRLDFLATEYIGCSLSETEMKDYIKVQFKISNTGKITLFGEEIRERDTFEEF